MTGIKKVASMIKLIIFDFDGVIITGSNEGYFTCYHKALEAVNIHLDPHEERKRILEIWGKGYKYQLEHLLKEHHELLPTAIKAYEQCYYSPVFSKNICLVKGADFSIKRLAKKHTLALASGMMIKTLNKFLKQFAIADLFERIITSDQIINPDDKKPAPYMLRKIMNDLSVDKSSTVYVGDAKSDVEMAHNANITPIVVLTGHLTRGEAKKLQVRYIIPDITHLSELFNKNPNLPLA